jgi:DNA recombination protein RmuC
MDLATVILLVAVIGSAIALLILVPGRVAAAVRAALLERLDALDRDLERTERGLREELGRGRGEAATEAQRQREATAADAQRQRELTAAEAKRQRDEVQALLVEMSRLQREALDGFAARLQQLNDADAKRQEELRKTLEGRLDAVREAVEARLAGLQKENAEKLEQMRQTVDEKLQGTLEKRLGESFKLVQGQLEQVQRGLGEMQALATGVGDLKKVLTNVKTRGTWGEVQLGALLEQMLSPDQYAANVAPKPGSGERVEFVIRLPGQGAGEGEVLLPIDAKFPTEDYQRLVEASEKGDAAGVEAAGKALELRIKGCARDIRDKYVHPPQTTDFGLLFLPTEGLYAEVVRRAGFTEALQREHRVIVAGPSTLAALLTSLQMGFRTLAIQQRSSEVWQVLGAVKTEFGKFGDVIARVEKKLEEASNTLSTVGQRSRAIERKLRTVQELPAGDAARLLPALAVDDAEGEPEEPGPG